MAIFAAVPEPGSLPLIATVLVMSYWFGVRRRMRRLP
jgi:hypothetical protein